MEFEKRCVNKAEVTFDPLPLASCHRKPHLPEGQEQHPWEEGLLPFHPILSLESSVPSSRAGGGASVAAAASSSCGALLRSLVLDGPRFGP